MKRKIITLTVLVTISLWLYDGRYNHSLSKVAGAPAKVCGAPADAGKTCAKSGCHTGNAVVVTNGIITSNVPASGYVHGNTYTITATCTQSGGKCFGFEISPQNSSGTMLGSIILTNTTETKLVGSPKKYITHKTAGTTTSTGTKSWSFNWTAPAQGTGAVTFYGAFNYANNNGSESGDVIHTSTLTIPEAPRLSNDVSTTAFGVYPNPFSGSTFINTTIDEQNPVSYEIFSLNGQLLESQQNVSDNKIEIGKELKSGIYFLQVHTGSETHCSKIVKQ